MGDEMGTASAETQPATGAATDARTPAVLLVEDERTLRDVLRRNLEARQYRVRVVETAEQALACIRWEQPSVMLLDINLPDRSGWDVLRELRAQGRHVPTIVLSAVRCGRERLDEFRPEAYLPKPFPLAALLAAVEWLTGRGEEARAAGG